MRRAKRKGAERPLLTRLDLVQDSAELENDSIKKRRVRRSKSQIYCDEVTKAMEKLWKHPDKRVIQEIKATATKKKAIKKIRKSRKSS